MAAIQDIVDAAAVKAAAEVRPLDASRTATVIMRQALTTKRADAT